MRFSIATNRRHVALFAGIASGLALLRATGDFTALARVSDAALESYDRVISDWGRNVLDHLDPTYPRCF
jgi:hypothetical protein